MEEMEESGKAEHGWNPSIRSSKPALLCGTLSQLLTSTEDNKHESIIKTGRGVFLERNNRPIIKLSDAFKFFTWKYLQAFEEGDVQSLPEQ